HPTRSLTAGSTLEPRDPDTRPGRSHVSPYIHRYRRTRRRERASGRTREPSPRSMPPDDGRRRRSDDGDGGRSPQQRPRSFDRSGGGKGVSLMIMRRARWVLIVSVVVAVGIWGYFHAQGRGSVTKYHPAVVERGWRTLV